MILLILLIKLWAHATPSASIETPSVAEELTGEIPVVCLSGVPP